MNRLAALVLLAIVGTFYFTNEPAPRVLIRWRDGVTPQERADMMRRFGLVRPHEAEGRAVMYDLLDTRAANIEELLEQPQLEGSGYLDDRSSTVSGEAMPGERRTWIVQQLVMSPELRAYRVIPLVIAICLTALAWNAAVAAGVNVARMRRRLRRVGGWNGLRRAAPGSAAEPPRKTRTADGNGPAGEARSGHGS